MDYESDLIVGLSGSAAVAATYRYQGGGTASLSGTPTLAAGAAYKAAGGLIDTSGDALVVKGFAQEVGTGWASLSGAALVLKGFFGEAGTGRFFFTGGANVFILTAHHLYDASGGISADGLSPTAATGSQGGGGGPAIGGSALSQSVQAVEFGFVWRSRKLQTDEFDFGWQTGARPFSWYRVTGEPGPSQCPQSPYPPKVPPLFVVNIMGRNVGDVCTKLKDRNFPGRIRKIEQFSTPAFQSAWDPSLDPAQNCLLDVTPSLSSQECVDLLIDFLPVQKTGWVGTYLPVYEVAGRGTVGLSGTPSVTFKPRLLMQGALSLTGSSADITCTAWRHEPEGGLGVVGEVAGDGTNTVALKFWTYRATGTFSPRASAKVTFASWGWQGSGQLGLSGVSNGVQGFPGSAGGDAGGLSGSADISAGSVAAAGGGAALSGEAFAAFPQHTSQASGGISLSGTSPVVASSYAVQASGGISVQGGGPYLPVAGAVSLGGRASANSGASVGGSGGPSLGGGAGVVPSVRVMDGGFGMSGVARAYTDDLGTVVTPLGWGSSVSDTRYVFRFEPAQPFSDVTQRVLSRCCVDTLPLIIDVDHQLAATSVFGQFLARNGLVLPSRIGIRYNRPQDLWHQTLHFSGYAAAYPLTETWDVSFTLKCLGRIEGAAVANAFLEFGVLVKNHGSDGRNRVTRFRVQYDSDTFCSANKSLLNFQFALDVRKLGVSPASKGDLVLQDEIGLYRGPAFQRNPRVRFKVSDNAADPIQSTVDIGPAIASALAAV